jgi:aspartate dehydrogenase
MKVGLLGCGAIGAAVVEATVAGEVANADIAGISTRTPARAHEVLDRVDLTDRVPVVDSPAALADEADVVVEAASQAALESHAVSILERGTDLVALSVGALADPALLERVRTGAVSGESRVRVPSGAVVGLDGLSALAASGVTAVSLTGYRPPAMLGPYVDDVETVAECESGTTLFEGSGAEAAEAFPAHMNIAMAVALAAGVDPDAVVVRLVLDHDAPRSRYVVEASGAAGDLTCEVENVTTPTDGDATHLVIDATLATVERLAAPVTVGT